MGSIGDQIMKYLDNQGYGTENVDLFLGFMPNGPDNCVVIYDEGAPSLDESSCLEVDLFGLQILVRNTNYDTCHSIINAIHKEVAGFGGQTLIAGGDEISYVTVQTSPTSIGKDDKGRNQWTSHYYVRATSILNDWRL